jgi:hypothetical protein
MEFPRRFIARKKNETTLFLPVTLLFSVLSSLIEGIKKHGEGKWKQIKSDPRFQQTVRQSHEVVSNC